MSEKELFSEAEVNKIIMRAVAMQEGAESSAYSPGVTLAEVEKIAVEMGVDPKHLEAAIAEAQANAEKQGKKWVFSTDIERVVDGEIGSENFDVVASRLPAPGANPLPSQIGKTLSAKVSSATSITHVAVSSRSGRTRIKVSSTPSIAAVYGFVSAIVCGIFGAGFIASGDLPGVGAGILAAGLASCVAWLVGGAKASRRQAEQIASDVESAVKDSVSESAKSRLMRASGNVEDPVHSQVVEQTTTD